MKRKKTLPPWTPFQEMTHIIDHEGKKPVPDNIIVYKNSRYQVVVTMMAPQEPFGEILWLSIKRLDQRPLHDWRDLQRLKNELVGPEYEAVEIYPAESRLVDTSNQYHLWCFVDRKGYKLPFGFDKRGVWEAKGTHALVKRAKQRPFENVPKDLITPEDETKMIEEYLANTNHSKQVKEQNDDRDDQQDVEEVVSAVGGGTVPVAAPPSEKQQKDDDQENRHG